MAVRAVTDARKVRQGRAEALALARQVDTVHIAKGKQVVTIAMHDAPDDHALAALLLGPSGNLRAPAIRQGRTLYVGFSEAAYEQWRQ